jgi:hypothetical protein
LDKLLNAFIFTTATNLSTKSLATTTADQQQQQQKQQHNNSSNNTTAYLKGEECKDHEAKDCKSHDLGQLFDGV